MKLPSDFSLIVPPVSWRDNSSNAATKKKKQFALARSDHFSKYTEKLSIIVLQKLPNDTVVQAYLLGKIDSFLQNS